MDEMNSKCVAVTKSLFFGALKYSGYHDFEILSVESCNYKTLKVGVRCHNCGKKYKIYVDNEKQIDKNELLKGDIRIDPQDN